MNEAFLSKVGLVALRQAEVDEWLVQVLVALLHPLPPSRVQVVVGGSSLVQKAKLIRELATESGLTKEFEFAPGRTIRACLGDVEKWTSERDRVVHSYYGEHDGDSVRRFRSRDPKPVTVTTEDLEAVIDAFDDCIEDLRTLVDVLHRIVEGDAETDRWEKARQAVHELMIAGHAVERDLMGPIQDAVASRALLRVRIRGVRREIVEVDDSSLKEDEFIAVIDPARWYAEIISHTGETRTFGDTGWRDVTGLARQEGDATVVSASVRRIGDTVLASVEGGELATGPWPDQVHRLAERAFGPTPGDGPRIPAWFSSLEGFRPPGGGEAGG